MGECAGCPKQLREGDKVKVTSAGKVFCLECAEKYQV